MKYTFSKSVAPIGLAVALGVLATGCAWSIGSDKQGARVEKPTRGQELIDLKKAKDQGAITDAEYEAQKQKLLEK